MRSAWMWKLFCVESLRLLIDLGTSSRYCGRSGFVLGRSGLILWAGLVFCGITVCWWNDFPFAGLSELYCLVGSGIRIIAL